MPIRIAERIEITGVVQGVGFRPFIHRLATELGLDGRVGNDSSRVFLEVGGTREALDELARRVEAEAPPLAIVESVRRMPCAIEIEAGFHIIASESVQGERTLVPPDTAVCTDCLAELLDPEDRRYHHPFITCTNCGPRFTIIRDLPYDRPNTTMADFEMCAACTAEYTDPADRRYHAQPIGCHECGPTLTYVTAGREKATDQAIQRAEAALASGNIVAVKGLGGYHLACDATDQDALRRLRERKHRPDKPFAVMVRDLDEARRCAHIDDAEVSQLVSRERPIVLLRARTDSRLLDEVAPGNPLIGIMLPYAPVHHLLLGGDLGPLVMTSANLGGQPIIHRDDDALAMLGGLCYGVLTHDRPIHLPCDDSVVRLVGETLLPVRRARGFAPVPVTLPEATRSVLAVGGELKNTFCVTSGRHAWVSQHIGDLENLETLQAFDASIRQFSAMYGAEPERVAVDSHPAYLSSSWAQATFPGRTIEVQHHHAHIAAVMAEHQLDPARPVIGFAFDGTGYGDDGTIWGGEVLLATADGYDRYAHLAPVTLPGGDAAIRNPYRIALAHLDAAGIGWTDDLAPVAELDATERRVLRQQLDRRVACVPTTSMGRLFDAIASLLGLRHRITYEAQAAIDLEIVATSADRQRPYRFGHHDGLIEAAPVVAAIVDDLRAGVAVAEIAAGFHAAVADAVTAVAEDVRSRVGLHAVALSGGVFQNALVTRLCLERLDRAGFATFTHRLVPPNDGGLALGQAFVAAHRSASATEET